jgi:hypothetical protein
MGDARSLFTDEICDHLTSAAGAPLARPRALLVLGFARSGTSALTHVLELLGVELGVNLKPAKAGANDKGYFENVDVHRWHVALFAALGAEWDEVAARPPRFWDVPATAAVRAGLRDTVAREFGGKPLWGFKDPELCLLYPLWEEMLAELHVEPSPILIARHPTEASSSFARLKGIGLQLAHLIWLRTVAAAERATRGRRRALVTYNGLMGDPRGATERIAQQLGLVWPRLPAEQASALAAFLDQSLHHHRADATSPTGELERLATQIYGAFARAASGADQMTKLATTVDAADTAITAALPLLAPLGEDARAAAQSARAAKQRTCAAAEKTRAERERAAAKIVGLSDKVERLRAALAAAKIPRLLRQIQKPSRSWLARLSSIVRALRTRS